MATNPPLDLTLTPLRGQGRTLEQWLTNFHLCVVVLDPYTNESAWALESAGRVLSDYAQADVRVGWVVTADADDAVRFLGPWSERLLTFADPDREVVKALGLAELPALVHINMSGAVEGVAEGWNPEAWREDVFVNLSRLLSWTVPALPVPGDPVAFAGSPALG
jgi:hypothetical protein